MNFFKIVFIILLGFLLHFSARSQQLYVVDAYGNISIVNLATCQVTPMVNAPYLWDIAMCPGDTNIIYALAGPPSKAIYEINVQTGVTTTLLANWPSSVNPVPVELSSLVCDGQGHLYACDDGSNQFYQFDIATNTWSFLGTVGPHSSGGDLTYFNGQLYLSTNYNELITINLNPFSYTEISQMNLGNVWGVNTVSTGTPCGGSNPQMVACTGSNIYYMDPLTGNATPACLNLPIMGGIYGATSVAEAPTSPVPGLTTTSPAPVCLGENVTLTVHSTHPFSYSWNPGGYTDSILVVPASNTTYTVTGTDVLGCSASAIVPVSIIPPPVPDFTSTVVCINNPTIFTNQSTGAPPNQWNWNFGDGNTSTQQNPSHAYGNPGTYTVTLVATNSSGCKDSIQKIVIVAPPPVSAFTYSGLCGQVTFTDQSTSSSSTGPISVWNWQFSGGTPSSSTSQNPGTITYPPGTYTASLIVSTAQGCSDTIEQVITVGGFPTAAFMSAPSCLGGSTQLTDGSLAVNGDPIIGWNWLMPAGNPATSNSQNTSTMYNTAGTHTVSLIVTTQQGCKDTITQQILVYNSPVANFSQPDSGCAPICVNYTDLSTSTDGTINGWQWSMPGGNPSSATTQNPSNICYTTPGSYSVSVIVTTQFGCKDTLALPMIEVYDWPTAEFCVTPGVAPTINPVFSFCDMWSSDVVSWSWNFGDNETDIINTDPVHSYSATANANDFYSYNICIRVENIHGCWDEICHPVELIPEFEFYIPNTFTPNGDWINETFYGKSRGVKEYNIWLFDRWGNQIWDCHVEDKNTNWDSDVTLPRQEGLSSFCKWDGKVVKGGVDMGGGSKQLAQEDVYVWKVRLTDIFDKKHTYIGHVTVVR